jgi:hypothetical protein
MMPGVTRGPFGWSKTTPLVLLPHLVQLSKNSRRRPETAREGCFFRAPLLLHTTLTVRVNRLDYETAIFCDGMHLLPRCPKDKLDSSIASGGQW